jgi:hypothetical protein
MPEHGNSRMAANAQERANMASLAARVYARPPRGNVPVEANSADRAFMVLIL